MSQFRPQLHLHAFKLGLHVAILLVQAQQLQQQLPHQPPAASYKLALQLGEILTQKLIQLDNVNVSGKNLSCTHLHLDDTGVCPV